MRLDQFLVEALKVESRSKAQELIKNSHVYHKTKKIFLTKASYQVSEAEYSQIQIKESSLLKFVSRAGLKLEAALKRVCLDVAGMTVLDIGQSTGGFTDCLIQNKASLVIGVDVGEGQVHEKVRSYSNVKVFEKTNIRDLKKHDNFLQAIPKDKFDLLVCDVSFISLNLVVPDLSNLLKAEGYYLFLVKPQFECGAENLNKNGVVKNVKVYDQIKEKMIRLFTEEFTIVSDYFESEILGKDGNKEFFIYGKNEAAKK